MRRGTSSTKSSTSRAISLIFVDRQDDLSCKGTEVDVFAGIVLTLYAVKAIFSKRSESTLQQGLPTPTPDSESGQVALTDPDWFWCDILFEIFSDFWQFPPTCHIFKANPPLSYLPNPQFRKKLVTMFASLACDILCGRNVLDANGHCPTNFFFWFFFSFNSHGRSTTVKTTSHFFGKKVAKTPLQRLFLMYGWVARAFWLPWCLLTPKPVNRRFSSMFNHGYLGSTVNGMRLRFKRRRPSMGVEGKKKSKKKVGGACSVGIKNIAPA
jgi:hypothetical protein